MKSSSTYVSVGILLMHALPHHYTQTGDLGIQNKSLARHLLYWSACIKQGK